ncbi:hypothetical protein ACQ4LE_009116 [Meloidogyne hapla]|uniref:Uncharacterized protein n=1 Tax=Meloidogyne hapla TaxID=6305 RepID=A0A1I8BHN3_MELHA
MKRAVNFDIPIIPTNDEMKEMQKIEEKNHPEYLKHARKLDDQGRPIPIPPPVITDEMIDVVRGRHEYEQEQERKETVLKIKKEMERQEILDLDQKQSKIITPDIFEEQKEEEEKTQVLVEEKETQDQYLKYDIEFEYMESIDRFRALFNDPEITHINISPQLCYVLGFPMRPVINGQVGKYGIDLKGGFTSFAVYSKGLTSSVIMGNAVSSLLRIVSVDNKSGGVIERVYDHPMFIPVLPREINEIEIELRWMNGSLVKFDHGTVIVTLMFNKMLRF